MALEVITGLFVIRWVVKKIEKNKIKKERIRLDKIYNDNLMGVYKGTIKIIEQQFPQANISKVWGIKSKGDKKDGPMS